MTVKASHPSFAYIVPPSAELEQIATGFLFTEGPLWHLHGERCRTGMMDCNCRILRSSGRYVALVTHASGTREWSPWFEKKLLAEGWIVKQTMGVSSSQLRDVAEPVMPAIRPRRVALLGAGSCQLSWSQAGRTLYREVHGALRAGTPSRATMRPRLTTRRLGERDTIASATVPPGRMTRSAMLPSARP